MRAIFLALLLLSGVAILGAPTAAADHCTHDTFECQLDHEIQRRLNTATCLFFTPPASWVDNCVV